MRKRSRGQYIGDDPLAFRVLTEISIVSQLSTNRASLLLAPELNMSQFVVLNHLARTGGERSLVQLARILQVTKGAMTNSVSRLVEKGWLIVRSDPDDRRGKLVRLSPEGKVARAKAVTKLSKELDSLEKTIPAEELENLTQSLGKLRLWFDDRR